MSQLIVLGNLREVTFPKCIFHHDTHKHKEHRVCDFGTLDMFEEDETESSHPEIIYRVTFIKSDK